MRNTVLSLLVASGLLLGGSAAYAQQAVNGKCQSIVSPLLGAIHQVEQGIDVMNNCFNVLAPGFFDFFSIGCGEERVSGNVIGEHGASCNALATVCDAVFTCFGMVPLGCEDVDECTIP